MPRRPNGNITPDAFHNAMVGNAALASTLIVGTGIAVKQIILISSLPYTTGLFLIPLAALLAWKCYRKFSLDLDYIDRETQKIAQSKESRDYNTAFRDEKGRPVPTSYLLAVM